MVMLAAVMTFFNPKMAIADIVTVTVKGTVDWGWDKGLLAFGTQYQSANFSGVPFTAVYTFDDTKGMETTSIDGSTGLPYDSKIEAVNWSNSPGMATISINGRTLALGTRTVPNPTSDSRYSRARKVFSPLTTVAEFALTTKSSNATSSFQNRLDVYFSNGPSAPSYPNMGHFWYDSFTQTAQTTDFKYGVFEYSYYDGIPKLFCSCIG